MLQANMKSLIAGRTWLIWNQFKLKLGYHGNEVNTQVIQDRWFNFAMACFSEYHTSTTSQAVCYVLTNLFFNIYVYTCIVIIYLLTLFLFINALNKSSCLLRSSAWLHVIMGLFGARVYKISDHTDTVRDKWYRSKLAVLNLRRFAQYKPSLMKG